MIESHEMYVNHGAIARNENRIYRLVTQRKPSSVFNESSSVILSSFVAIFILSFFLLVA